MNAQTFAGIAYPKPLWTLHPIPRDPAQRRKRLESLRRPTVGGYYYAEPRVVRSAADCEIGSYHEADGPALGLRWRWCDEVPDVRIEHTGWWTDDDGCGDTMRGFVARLPHGRGFVIGWRMGRGMCCDLDYSRIWDCERDAAHAADSMAEHAAEAERDYQRAELARLEREEAQAREDDTADDWRVA